MSARAEARLWLVQRASAAVLALCVAVHLATMIVAVRGGLSAADLLGRTRGSMLWASFYGVFVIAVAIHAAIGVRNVLAEWSRLNERHSGILATIFGSCLLVLGLRAVAAVVL